MKHVSKEVDGALKRLYAELATVAARRALTAMANDRFNDVDRPVSIVEKYLVKAGASATRWTFRIPTV